MKMNENILRDVLREAIADANRRPNTFQKQIQITMSHMYNVSPGETAFMLNGRTPVDTMSEDTMFKLTTVLYELNKTNPSDTFDYNKLDTDRYFTENEKIKYNQKYNREVIDQDIVFKNWRQVANDQYVIVTDNKELTKLASLNKIHYNPETQRALTIIHTKEGIIKKVTIIPEAYEAIYENMRAGNHIPDELTFNVNPDFYEPPKIFRDNLVIPKESIIDCIDGYHRLKAMINLTLVDPNFYLPVILVITVFTVEKAKQYILQKDKKNHLTDEQITQYDQYDAANFIIEKLKQSMYFKNGNIDDISYTLNKIITQIFKPENLKKTEARPKAVALFKEIESRMNDLIESKGYFNKILTKEEWFIYLYLIRFSINNKKDFLDIVDQVNIDDLLSKIKITNKPISKHFSIMSEVIDNVERKVV